VFVVVWEFEVRPGREADFEARYGPKGDWVRLFEQGEGYRGTVLMRDRAVPGRYLLTDTWRDGADYRAFKAGFAAEYAALDGACTALTRSERCLGEFEAV
jgi:heme-degrading monooxygenase HmoA